MFGFCFFFFKQKTAYEMRISDWSSDVCSSDLALLLVLKTIRGDITPQDWDGFQKRLETVQMSPDNRRATLILTHHLSKGVKLDKQRLLKALATLTQRGSVKPIDLASMGYFIMNELAEPELAIDRKRTRLNSSH